VIGDGEYDNQMLNWKCPKVCFKIVSIGVNCFCQNNKNKEAAIFPDNTI